MDTLAPQICAAEQSGQITDALRRAFVAEVEAVSKNLPDSWFELGRKNKESVSSLAHRVLIRAHRDPLGRFPFLGRTLFRSTREEMWGDPPVRYHTFRARLSITREVLRSDRAFNLVRDPVARAADERYRAISAALRAVGVPVEAGARTMPLFVAPGGGIRLARDPARVVEALRGRSRELDLNGLVLALLEGVGQPLSVPAVVAALAPLLPPLLGAVPDVEVLPEPAVDAPDVVLRRGVRMAVAAAWADLSGEEQALLLGVARGEDGDALMARCPGLKSRVAVSRAITRLNNHFLGRVLGAVGGEARPEAAPRALLELILEVLMAEVVEVRDVRAG